MAEGSSSHAAPDAPPRTVDLAIDTDLVDPEDDEEWEYEYSATETETYYVALDLSIPEWVYRNPLGIIHAGRAGYYADQINDPDLESRRSMAKTFVPPGADLEEEEEDLPEPEDDMGDNDRDAPTITNPGLGSAPTDTNSRLEDKLVERELEILDLHTPNPIISYRGRVFEGSWAEILGTEMIFMAHDEMEPIPALRRLRGDVDLLAAATARIQTKEKVLRVTEERDPYKEIKAKMNIRVSVSSKHSNDEKMRQAKFLENLWAAKAKKGEKDMPTITARPAPDKDFDDNKDPDKIPGKPRGRARGGAAVKAAAAAAAEALARKKAAASVAASAATSAVPETNLPGPRRPLPSSRPGAPTEVLVEEDDDEDYDDEEEDEDGDDGEDEDGDALMQD